MWELLFDITKHFFNEHLKDQFLSKKPRRKNPIEYQSENDLSKKANNILRKISYKSGAVSLEKIISLESLENSLVFIKSTSGGMDSLGKISFNPACINIFCNPDDVGEGRFRFTVAHELGHYFLDHGRYIKYETLQEPSFFTHEKKLQHISSISRLEYQANYFASCLLMPDSAIIEELALAINAIELRLHGRHVIYVDDQRCNLTALDSITSRLSRIFKVSKQAIYIKLLNLDLIIDRRNITEISRCT